jgi:hypothetical protein
MDSVDIGDLIDRFAEVKGLTPEHEQKLGEVFGWLEDTTDSALKILIPLLLAYSDKDNFYGKESEKLVSVSILENNRIKITVNAPISMLDIQPGPGGIYCGSGVNQPFGVSL